MQRKYLIYIALGILIILGGWFLLGRDGTNTPDKQEQTVLDQNDIETLLPKTSEEESASTTEEEPQLESEADNNASTDETETLPDEEAPVPETKTYVVTYTDAGFTPKTITIEAGDTVTFVNESSYNMWVASAIHPTHNEYPEESDSDCLGSSFDECTGTPSGTSWSFTFNKVGVWGYHNHLSPSRTGTVEVK